jgi:hypothetical protein
MCDLSVLSTDPFAGELPPFKGPTPSANHAPKKNIAFLTERQKLLGKHTSEKSFAPVLALAFLFCSVFFSFVLFFFVVVLLEVQNSLRYIPERHHAVLGPEFLVWMIISGVYSTRFFSFFVFFFFFPLL